MMVKTMVLGSITFKNISSNINKLLKESEMLVARRRDSERGNRSIGSDETLVQIPLKQVCNFWHYSGVKAG